MRKFTLLVGVGIGYVLGAAAGRQRYDQIKAAAGKAWGNPKVQDTVGTAQRTAVQQAKSASTAVKDKLPGGDGAPTSSPSTPTPSTPTPAKPASSTPAPASGSPTPSPATTPTPTPPASSPASTGSTPGTTATTTPGTVSPPAKKP